MLILERRMDMKDGILRFPNFNPFEIKDVSVLLDASNNGREESADSSGFYLDTYNKCFKLECALYFLIAQCIIHGGKFGARGEDKYQFGIVYVQYPIPGKWVAKHIFNDDLSTSLFWFSTYGNWDKFLLKPEIVSALNVLYGINTSSPNSTSLPMSVSESIDSERHGDSPKAETESSDLGR